MLVVAERHLEQTSHTRIACKTASRSQQVWCIYFTCLRVVPKWKIQAGLPQRTRRYSGVPSSRCHTRGSTARRENMKVFQPTGIPPLFPCTAKPRLKCTLWKENLHKRNKQPTYGTDLALQNPEFWAWSLTHIHVANSFLVLAFKGSAAPQAAVWEQTRSFSFLGKSSVKNLGF